MTIILIKIKYCYKLSNFCPSNISYLTFTGEVFHICVTTNVIKVWQ